MLYQRQEHKQRGDGASHCLQRSQLETRNKYTSPRKMVCKRICYIKVGGGGGGGSALPNFFMFNKRIGVFNPYFIISTCPTRKATSGIIRV